MKNVLIIEPNTLIKFVISIFLDTMDIPHEFANNISVANELLDRNNYEFLIVDEKVLDSIDLNGNVFFVITDKENFRTNDPNFIDFFSLPLKKDEFILKLQKHQNLLV